MYRLLFSFFRKITKRVLSVVTIYTIWVQLPMVIVIYFISIIFFVFLFQNPLFYSLSLVFLSSFAVFHLVFNSVIPASIGFILLLVYLGAILILFSYVCAVVPNLSYGSLSLSLRVVLVIVSFIIIFLLNFSLFYFTSTIHSFNLVSYFYRTFGILSFLTTIIFILIILYSCSVFTQVSSPFRSI